MMKIKYILKTTFAGLRNNKSRAALTILGIVIGITSIMLIMSLGKGAQDLILSQVQSFGAKTIVVHPGRRPESLMSSAQMMNADSLRERDLNELKKKTNAPHVVKVEPLNVGGATAVYENETYGATILGGGEYLQEIYDIRLKEGRFINLDDIQSHADVVVIGSKVKEELFGGDEAIVQKIRMKNRNYRVVGILQKKGQSFISFDETAILPYTTAQTYVFGIKYFHHIIAEVDSEDAVDAAIKDIEITLRNNHNITDPTKDDFWIVTQQTAIEQVKTITNVLTLFLIAVAAISLVVGGVGIMNIMLVSVTERTREIGLRKAVGATNGNIMAQFLTEAIFLTGLGGIIGIILGASFSLIAALVLSKVVGLDWIFTFPISATFLGLGVSAGVGFLFGLYPARQAAKKSPIDALRYE